MNKGKIILISTVFPVIIGTAIFVGYFWISDRLATPKDLESCSDYYLSNTDYIVSIFVIALIATLYQLTAGNLLKERLKNNKAAGYLINILSFALCMTGILLQIAIVTGKPWAGIGIFFLAAIMLGILIEVFLLISTRKSTHPS
jgi:hypothetical protein